MTRGRADPILIAICPRPYIIGETPDASNAGSLAPRPDAIRNGNLPRGQKGPDLWFDPAAFQRQAPNTFGNAGVGTIVDPGIANIDFAMQKRFRITESKQVEFRAEAFNLFNTPLFQGVSRTLGSATFGKVTSSQYERELQMGLKLYFWPGSHVVKESSDSGVELKQTADSVTTADSPAPVV